MAKEPRREHSAGFWLAAAAVGEPGSGWGVGREVVVVVGVMVTVMASVTEPSFAAAAACAMARPPSVGRKWSRGEEEEEEEGRLVAATAARVGTATSGNAGTTAAAAGERLLANIYELLRRLLLLLLKLADIERRCEKYVSFVLLSDTSAWLPIRWERGVGCGPSAWVWSVSPG